MGQILEIQFFISNLNETKISDMIRSIAVCFLFGVLLSTLGSCKKCYECDFGTKGTRELCSKDFEKGASSAFDITIEAYEAQGYKCTEK